jgi:hypothetical protein
MLADEVTSTSGSAIHFTDKVEVSALVANVRQRGIHLVEIDLTGIEIKDDLLERIAHAMSFPEYSASNWDALEESIRDLSWIPAAGYVLVARSAESLMRHHPRLAGQLIESWMFCAEDWKREGKPFHMVLEW